MAETLEAKQCAICDRPATHLDLHFPYFTGMNRCDVHKDEFCDTCAHFRVAPVNQCGLTCRRSYCVDVCGDWRQRA
jgi:hypothetical protein